MENEDMGKCFPSTRVAVQEVRVTDHSNSERPNISIVGTLAVIMAAASIVSLVQRTTGIEIVNEIAGDALSLYRQMIVNIHTVVFDWWTPVELPWGLTFVVEIWAMDILAIWLLCVGGVFRNFLHQQSYSRRVFPEGRSVFGVWVVPETVRPKNMKSELSAVILTILLGPIMWAFLILHSLRLSVQNLLMDRSNDDFFPDGYDMNERWEVNIILARSSFFVVIRYIAPAIIAAAFFLWNAIQISP